MNDHAELKYRNVALLPNNLRQMQGQSFLLKYSLDLHPLVDYKGVISLCLWGISPSDFASFAHHFASFPHQICFISPTNCFISPTNCFISPTSCFISPTKFSLPHHYFASLCQKLEHNFLIFFPFFHLWSLILNNLFSGNC